MQFKWDSNKNEVNKRKHGVGFEAAKLVFDDPFHLTMQDRIENGELRWQTIGNVGGLALLLLAHTWLNDGETEEIRIISARKATRLERQFYEKNIQFHS